MKMDKYEVDEWVSKVNWDKKQIEDVMYLDNETCILRYVRGAFGRFQLLVNKTNDKTNETSLHNPSLVSNNVLDMLSLSIIHGMFPNKWSFGEERISMEIGLVLGLEDESTDEQLLSLRKKLKALPEMELAETSRAYAEMLIQERGRIAEGEDMETHLRVMNRILSGKLLLKKVEA